MDAAMSQFGDAVPSAFDNLNPGVLTRLFRVNLYILIVINKGVTWAESCQLAIVDANTVDGEGIARGTTV